MNDKIKKPSMEYCRMPGKGFGVVFENLPQATQDELLGLCRNNYTTSAEYKLCRESHAFLQGHDERGGWVFIEFWSEQSAQLNSVRHLETIFLQYHSQGEVKGLYRLPDYVSASVVDVRTGEDERFQLAKQKVIQLAVKDFEKPDHEIRELLKDNQPKGWSVMGLTDDLNRMIGVMSYRHNVELLKKELSGQALSTKVRDNFNFGELAYEVVLFLCR